MGDSPTYDAFRGIRRFSALDGFRALSVVAVVWHHTSGREGAGLAGRGALGVDFFFVISGFLITTLLLRERAAAGRINLRNFYIRRTLRIFPLYYAVLAVYVVLILLREEDAAGRSFIDRLPAFLTYTSNWFVELDGSRPTTFYFAWSLATEEQFYLLWPPLLVALLLAPKLWPLLPIAVLVGVIAVDQVATRSSHAPGLGWTIVTSLATPILFGVIAAIVVHHPGGFRFASATVGQRAANAALLAATLVLIHLGTADVLIAVMLTLVVIASCIREDSVLHPALTWRPIALVGVISYGVYLMHMLAANAVRTVLGHDFGIDVFGLTLPVVVAAAWMSHRYFEAPVMRLGHRFRAPQHDVSEVISPTHAVGGERLAL